MGRTHLSHHQAPFSGGSGASGGVKPHSGTRVNLGSASIQDQGNPGPGPEYLGLSIAGTGSGNTRDQV